MVEQEQEQEQEMKEEGEEDRVISPLDSFSQGCSSQASQAELLRDTPHTSRIYGLSPLSHLGNISPSRSQSG